MTVLETLLECIDDDVQLGRDSRLCSCDRCHDGEKGDDVELHVDGLVGCLVCEGEVGIGRVEVVRVKVNMSVGWLQKSVI